MVETNRLLEPRPQLNADQLVAILNASHDAITSVDMNRTIRSWNPSATRLFGYSELEAIGQNIDYLIVPVEMRAEILRHYPVNLSFQQPHLLNTVRRHKDGHLVSVEVSVSPISDGADNVTGICAIYRDISERVAAVQMLSESQERYRNLFSTIDEGFCVVEVYFDDNANPVDYRFLEINPSFEKHSGIQNALGKTIREITSDIEPYWLDLFGSVALDGKSVHYEHQANSLAGKWFEGHAVRLGGQDSRKIAILFNDITVRKLAEEALRKSEAFNTSIFEASPDCLKVLNTSGQLEYMNANGCELLEINDFASFKGTAWSSFWPMEDRQLVNIAVAGAVRGQKSRFEGFCPTLEGTPKWWDVAVSPVTDSAGKTFRIVASSRDITERKITELALNESQTRLNHAANAARLTYVEINLQQNRIKMADNYARIMGYKPPVLLNEEDDIEIAVQSLLAHVIPRDRQHVEESLKEFLAGKPNGEIQYGLSGDDNVERIFESVWSIESSADGKPLKTFATNRDITESTRLQEYNKLLVEEVNHRAKNMLSVVQAVARQTARGGDPLDFVQRFSERLNSLAASHDLLVKNQWRATPISQLVHAQLLLFEDLIGTRILIHGPDANLRIGAAQGIGMALHELATNAVKYGALSNRSGIVHVAWEITDDKTPLFVMSWSEEGGPVLTPPSRKGFGHIVIGPMVESSVQGEVEIIYQEHGLRWTLRAPAESNLESAKILVS